MAPGIATNHVYFMVIAASSTSLTMSTNGDFWPETSSMGWSNRRSDARADAAQEFVIEMERNARGRVRVRLPPQPAAIDPWIPPELAPMPAPIAWPTMLRRFRSQRS